MANGQEDISVFKFKSALLGELGVIPNPNGGFSSELSITVTDSRLNGGLPTNIPQLIKTQPADAIQRILNGQASRDDINRAIERAVQRVSEGQVLPKFSTIEEAVKAAGARSDELGRKGRGAVRQLQER